MSSLSGLNRNMMRLSGMSSGMDTETIVSNMLKIDQQKVDRQYRSQAKMEWKVSAYQDVNNELRKLKDEYSTVLKQEQNMLSAYNYRAYKMTYQNTSDSAYVTMRAEPYATEGSVSLKIHQLAEAATYTSANKITGANGEGLKLTMTMSEVNSAIIAGGGNGFTIGEDGMISFGLGSQEYTFSKYATLDTVINAVNANNEGMKLGYSQLTDKFTISSKVMGAAGSLMVESNAFTNAILGVASGTPAVHSAGKNAKVTINGVTVERSSNSFEIDGISYTLKQVTDVKNADGTTDSSKIVNVDIERDLDTTVNLVKKFVDSYNGLLEKLQGLLSEKPDRDYYPLTEEERSDLSETELTKWESEAKKGLLRNDSQITGLIMQMRSSFYMKVPGSNLMLADIGLGGAASSTDGYEKARKGFIEVDETKLRNALKENPDMVFQMFTYKGEESDNVDEMGLVTRLNTLMDNYVKQNERETQYYANLDIARAKERYIDMVEAMYKKEETLWARFTAMEKAMTQLNAQSSWLQQQLGGAQSSDS